MKIEKISEEKYQLSDGKDKIIFSKEKFEDLYYAVPINTTAFLRLLLENICASIEERQKVNAMLEKVDEKSSMLEELQKQIQAIDYPD